MKCLSFLFPKKNTNEKLVEEQKTKILSLESELDLLKTRLSSLEKKEKKDPMVPKKKKTKLPQMHCEQCEQRTEGGCISSSDCGKSTQVSALQDLMNYMLKGVCYEIQFAKKESIKVDPELEKTFNHMMVKAIFACLTNVNFDPNRFVEIMKNIYEIRVKVEAEIKKSGKELKFDSPTAKRACMFNPNEHLDDICGSDTLEDMEDLFGHLPKGFGWHIEVKENEDIRSLKNTLDCGVRGTAAYAEHALVFGKSSQEVFDFIHEAMVATMSDNDSIDYWVGLLMKCGKMNLEAMRLLDEANCEAYGSPEPSEVFLGHKKGPAILVSGHDLKDMKMLLEQTEGTGVNIYTHGEMLPSFGYPKLKQHKHLIGNFGQAWFKQQSEFKNFPGPILMTTNCIVEPNKYYEDRIYTTGVVGWEGLPHIKRDKDGNKDFSILIKKAKEIGGFKEDKDGEKILTGFGHKAILGVADKVVAGVKNGAIKHLFVVGGCDGSDPKRRYYTELVQRIPKDCVILTLGCGKYRFYKEKREAIGGIPTLLDVGQCNDTFGAIQVAVALAKVFDCGVNDLPLSIILSWFEQKAVSILLTLFALGIKNIKIGPTLPGFMTPNVINLLVKTFQVAPVTTAEQDLKEIFDRKKK